MRIHHALAGRDVVEKRMMGALVFMVDGHMCCGLTKGALMVRVGAEGREAALARPHVRPMSIGGRSPRGFVFVEPEGFASDADLHRWISDALAYVATLPPRTTERVISRVR
jgi:hypothetical protein